MQEMHIRFRWCVGDKYDGGGMKGAIKDKAEEGRGEAQGRTADRRRDKHLNKNKFKA